MSDADSRHVYEAVRELLDGNQKQLKTAPNMAASFAQDPERVETLAEEVLEILEDRLTGMYVLDTNLAVAGFLVEHCVNSYLQHLVQDDIPEDLAEQLVHRQNAVLQRKGAKLSDELRKVPGIGGNERRLILVYAFLRECILDARELAAMLDPERVQPEEAPGG